MHLRRSCGHTLLVPAMAIVHSTVIFWQANYPASECVPAAGFSGGFLRLLRWVSDGRRWVLKTWNLWQLCADFTSGNGKPASGLRPQVIVGFVGAENMILPWRYVQLCVLSTKQQQKMPLSLHLKVLPQQRVTCGRWAKKFCLWAKCGTGGAIIQFLPRTPGTNLIRAHFHHFWRHFYGQQ